MISIEELRTTALSLSEKDCGGLANALILSLAHTSQEFFAEDATDIAYPNEYEQEVERRSAGYERGELRAISKEQLFQRMHNRA